MWPSPHGRVYEEGHRSFTIQVRIRNGLGCADLLMKVRQRASPRPARDTYEQGVVVVLMKAKIDVHTMLSCLDHVNVVNALLSSKVKEGIAVQAKCARQVAIRIASASEIPSGGAWGYGYGAWAPGPARVCMPRYIRIHDRPTSPSDGLGERHTQRV